jgi:hypothetical protein
MSFYILEKLRVMLSRADNNKIMAEKKKPPVKQAKVKYSYDYWTENSTIFKQGSIKSAVNETLEPLLEKLYRTWLWESSSYFKPRSTELKAFDQAVKQCIKLSSIQPIAAQLKLDMALVPWRMHDKSNDHIEKAIANLRERLAANSHNDLQQYKVLHNKLKPSTANQKVDKLINLPLEKLYRTWIWESSSYFKSRSAELKVLDQAVKNYIRLAPKNTGASVELNNAFSQWRESGEVNSQVEKAIANLKTWLANNNLNSFQQSDARHSEIASPTDYKHLALWWRQYGRLSVYKIMSTATRKLERHIIKLSNASSENFAEELKELLKAIDTWQAERGHQSDRLKVVYVLRDWAEEKVQELRLAEVRLSRKWPGIMMNLLLLPITLCQLPIWEDLLVFY